jgi:hypothetical protein
MIAVLVKNFTSSYLNNQIIALAVECRWNPMPQDQNEFTSKNQTASISIYAIAGAITP